MEREKSNIFGQISRNLYRYYLSKYCFKLLIWFRLNFRYSIELILIMILNFSYNRSYNYFFFMYYFYLISCMFWSHVGSMQSWLPLYLLLHLFLNEFHFCLLLPDYKTKKPENKVNMRCLFLNEFHPAMIMPKPIPICFLYFILFIKYDQNLIFYLEWFWFRSLTWSYIFY